MNKIKFIAVLTVIVLCNITLSAWTPTTTIELKVGELYTILGTNNVFFKTYHVSGDAVAINAGNASNTEAQLASHTGCQVYAVRPGVAYVTVRTSIWGSGTCTHSLYKFIVTGETLEPTEMMMQHQLTMEIGASYTITPKFYPDGTTCEVTWYSSNPDVVSVAQGNLVAKSVGEATVTCISAYGLRQDCNVTVTPKMAENISLNTDRLNMSIGDSFQFISTITPDADTSKRVLWKSLNPAVVSVDENGVAQCLDNGWTVVLATTTDGTNLTAGCFVQVGKDFHGDLNDDGKIDVSDVNRLINVILGV